MVQKIFHTLLLRRHFWRYATFDEVVSLYVSRMLRMAALNLMSAFTSIYLYQLGYSVMTIALLWTGFYVLKAVTSLLLARGVAWIGPKHAILVSNLLYIPAMILYALLPTHGIELLIPALVAQALSSTLYTIAYNVDFSKVKSDHHAGKEIAYMNMFEKITTGLSPLLGGFIAFLWGPQVVVCLAALLFAFAAVPLLRTDEPIAINRKLSFRGFPWRLLFRHSLAQFGYGFDVFASGVVWTLYVAIVILGMSDNNNDVYAATGVLVSVVFVAAIIASYTYGKIIDKRRGGELLRVATVANALTHLMRPFVQSPVMVAGLNAANELATTGFLLPYTRALFDNADISGSRVTYLGVVETIANCGAALAAGLLACGAAVMTEQVALQTFFFIAAGMALTIATARFPLYKK